MYPPRRRRGSCPRPGTSLIRRYHDRNPDDFVDPCNTPLLRLINGNVTYAFLQKRIKAMFAAMGEDATFVSTRSLRVGGATALLAAGASETAVKQAGRWLSSDMPQLYDHASNESVQQFYDRMLSTPTLTADSRHHVLGWF
jgi:site-specific recombinase XerD